MDGHTSPARVVIYDMSSVLAHADTITFMPNVEAVLLVMRGDVMRTDDVKQFLERLAGASHRRRAQ